MLEYLTTLLSISGTILLGLLSILGIGYLILGILSIVLSKASIKVSLTGGKVTTVLVILMVISTVYVYLTGSKV